MQASILNVTDDKNKMQQSRWSIHETQREGRT